MLSLECYLQSCMEGEIVFGERYCFNRYLNFFHLQFVDAKINPVLILCVPIRTPVAYYCSFFFSK